MKRWAIGSVAFFLSFGLGLVTAGLSHRTTPTLDDPDENENQKIIVNESKESRVAKDSEPNMEIINEEKDFGTRYKIKLLTTGEGFHGDEVDAKNGEKWLGLFDDGGHYRLREVSLKIDRVFDDIVDDPRSRIKTGKSVATGDTSRSILLLKNAGFPKGDVPTLFVGNTWDDVRKPEYEHLLPEDIVMMLKRKLLQIFPTRRGDIRSQSYTGP